jgi:TonB family protein
LRSGIPDTLPGRSVNLGEHGVAAVLAGEVQTGEAVGVEIRLPQVVEPLRTRALVRNHDKLRCGMEFTGLSPEQQAAIRNWVGASKAEPELEIRTRIPIEAEQGSDATGLKAAKTPTGKRGRGWIFLLGSIAILLAVLWWRWNRGWQDLESGLQRETTAAQQAQVHVPAEEMEKLVIHRVDPDYPAAARPGNLQGVVVLDVVVGRDGSVADMHALNGPEVLAQAAMEAMRWWRFEPYLVEGQPVVVETTVAMEFKP